MYPSFLVQVKRAGQGGRKDLFHIFGVTKEEEKEEEAEEERDAFIICFTIGRKSCEKWRERLKNRETTSNGIVLW